MEQKLRQVWVKWGEMVNLLGREVADRRTAGRFYVAVMQEVIVFGSYMWVITPWMENARKGFHHWAVRLMAGMGPKRQWDETWV